MSSKSETGLCPSCGRQKKDTWEFCSSACAESWSELWGGLTPHAVQVLNYGKVTYRHKKPWAEYRPEGMDYDWGGLSPEAIAILSR